MSQPLSSKKHSIPEGYSLESDPDVLSEYSAALETVAKAGGVRLMRGRELAAAVVADGCPIAGLWTEASGDTFTFDIAVAQDHQRKGIGRYLTGVGASIAREMAEAGYRMELTAISEGGERLAKGLGLIETHRQEGLVVLKDADLIRDELNKESLALVEQWPALNAGEKCAEWTVRAEIHNRSSIGASLGENYETHGVREVPMSALGPDPGPSVRQVLARNPRIAALAEEIQRSGELTPLIVVVDGGNGNSSAPAYVLEGSHRIDALELLGTRVFPALVVRDLCPEIDVRRPDGRWASPSERFRVAGETIHVEQKLLSGETLLVPPHSPAEPAPKKTGPEVGVG